MDHFEYRNGKLFCEELCVLDIAAQVGTPAYIYSKATLLHHYRRFAESFAELNPWICFSIKSLANLHILKILAAARVVIGIKLHIGIAAVSQRTPFVQAAYRMKCYDFAESINAEGALVRTDDPELAEGLQKRLQEGLQGICCWNQDKVEGLRAKFLGLKEYL